MTSEPHDHPDRETIIELDRRAWNLPTPPVGPTGPVRDVWPVRSSSPTRAVDDRVGEPVAAA